MRTKNSPLFTLTVIPLIKIKTFGANGCLSAFPDLTQHLDCLVQIWQTSIKVSFFPRFCYFTRIPGVLSDKGRQIVLLLIVLNNFSNKCLGGISSQRLQLNYLNIYSKNVSKQVLISDFEWEWTFFAIQRFDSLRSGLGCSWNYEILLRMLKSS